MDVTFSHDDVEILQQNTAYKGYFSIERYELRFRLFEGGWSKTIQREVFERGKAAGILLYDPEQNTLVLTEQFRVGALQGASSPWLIELVAGVIESDEQPSDVVIREAVEEVGATVLDVLPICNYWVSPGGTSEEVFLFCGRVDATQTAKFGGIIDHSEDIKVLVIQVSDAFEALSRGQIINAPTIIALQWLKLNLTDIRQQWLANK